MKDQWKELIEREEEIEIVTLELINRKVNALIEGLGLLMSSQTSILKGQSAMQAELQPIADALAHLTEEEGLVKTAVDKIVAKVDNGQVVNKEDVASLVAGIDAVSNALSGVVTEADPAPAEPAPVEPPAEPAPVEPAPVEPPAEPAPVEVTEPAPVEPTPPVTELPSPPPPPDLTPATDTSV